ncbi:MAG: radical SAM protein [Elusimicrobiota bacterium]
MSDRTAATPGRAARKAEAVAEAARGLEWDYVRYQLDSLLDSGLALLPAAGAASSPRELHLELTHRCNLKCVMCEHWQLEHLDPDSVRREMDFAAIRRAVEGAALLGGVETVVVTGGEPWLRHDFTDIVAWLAAALPRAEIVALTNFWNTGHLALKLRELGARGLFSPGGPSRLKLGSSLDGLEGTHDRVRGQAGAFAGLVRSVKTLKAEFPEVSFGFTFTMIPQNAGELHDAYRFVTRELGVGFGAQWAVETAGIEPIVWTPEARAQGLRGIRRIAEEICAEHGAAALMSGPARRASAALWSELLYWRYLEEYGREARRFPFFLRCTAGERHVMVGAEGEVFYCPVNRARTIGNIRETPLDEMWSSPKAAREREFVASGQCHCWLRCVSSPAVNRLLDLGLAAPDSGR